MTARRQRLTITVDPDLVDVGNRAVASGAAESLSAWVSLVLSERSRREAELDQLRRAIAEYEAEHGAITSEEIAALRP